MYDNPRNIGFSYRSKSQGKTSQSSQFLTNQVIILVIITLILNSERKINLQLQFSNRQRNQINNKNDSKYIKAKAPQTIV